MKLFRSASACCMQSTFHGCITSSVPVRRCLRVLGVPAPAGGQATSYVTVFPRADKASACRPFGPIQKAVHDERHQRLKGEQRPRNLSTASGKFHSRMTCLTVGAHGKAVITYTPQSVTREFLKGDIETRPRSQIRTWVIRLCASSHH